MAGPQAALVELSTLDSALNHYHLFHATRAELLRELGQPEQARAADRRALGLTTNPAEQSCFSNESSTASCHRTPV